MEVTPKIKRFFQVRREASIECFNILYSETIEKPVNKVIVSLLESLIEFGLQFAFGSLISRIDLSFYNSPENMKEDFIKANQAVMDSFRVSQRELEPK